MLPIAAHEPATASRMLTPSRWMSRPTNAATTTDPMVLTSRISPRSPTGTPKLWRIAGQAVPSIPSGRPTATNVPRLKRSNLRSIPAVRFAAVVIAPALSCVKDFDPGHPIRLERLVVDVAVRDQRRDRVDLSHQHRHRGPELV